MSTNPTPLLINKDDFTEDVIIPGTIQTERIEKAIRAAQNHDLRPLIGDAFYTDLINNFDQNDSDITHPYVLLMDGTTYENNNSDQVFFPGLKMALKFWAAARFVEGQLFTITTHSIVQKLQDDSQPVSAKIISQMAENYRSQAVGFWEQAKCYLNADVNEDVFEFWKKEKSTPRAGYRINAIGGNSNV